MGGAARWYVFVHSHWGSDAHSHVKVTPTCAFKLLRSYSQLPQVLSPSGGSTFWQLPNGRMTDMRARQTGCMTVMRACGAGPMSD